jgi:predicted phage-related endonuclease
MVSKVTPNTMMSASRLPALMGLSKYRSPNDELTATISALRGEDWPDIGNEAMAWGNQLEPIILREAARRLELTDLITEHPEPFFHRDFPLACSLDGSADGRGQVLHTDPDAGIYVVGQDSIQIDGLGVLEAKLTSQPAEDMPPLWRGPIQLQAQMAILGAKWGCIATLYQGTELRLFLFAPHEQTLGAIRAACEDFQRRLLVWKDTGTVDFYPPQDSKDANRMYPQAEPDSIIHLDDTAQELAMKMLAAKIKIDKAEADRADAEKKLKKLIGTASKAVAGNYLVSWPMRNYQAQPAKTVPAKEAYSIRQSTLSIKEIRP